MRGHAPEEDLEGMALVGGRRQLCFWGWGGPGWGRLGCRTSRACGSGLSFRRSPPQWGQQEDPLEGNVLEGWQGVMGEDRP